jgi:AmmeMemoRadiSam system protein A
MDLSPQQCRTLLGIAARVIRGTLDGRSYRPTEMLDDASIKPYGCFVSLHRADNHALRGCVGRLGAAQDLLELVRSAAASVLEDPRFENHPVTLAELPDLEVEISLLTPLQEKPNPLNYDPLTEGIYLTIGDRAGLFLPQVARETGWTREQLLTRLCTEKMGLPADSWRQPEAKLQTFTTLILGPEAFERLIGSDVTSDE